MKKKLLIVLLIIIVSIQFIRPTKNQNSEAQSSDITKVRNVPSDVLQIFKASCYDCHSNYTVYPWYSNIQPIAWWLQGHINEGKKNLNFSEFGNYSAEKAKNKMNEIVEVLEENEMPLFSYTIIHRNAKLSEAQKAIIINWAKKENSNQGYEEED